MDCRVNYFHADLSITRRVKCTVQSHTQELDFTFLKNFVIFNIFYKRYETDVGEQLTQVYLWDEIS